MASPLWIRHFSCGGNTPLPSQLCLWALGFHHPAPGYSPLGEVGTWSFSAVGVPGLRASVPQILVSAPLAVPGLRASAPWGALGLRVSALQLLASALCGLLCLGAPGFSPAEGTGVKA